MFQISQNPSLRFSMIEMSGVGGEPREGSCAIYTKATPVKFNPKKSADSRRRFVLLEGGVLSLCMNQRSSHAWPKATKKSSRSAEPISPSPFESNGQAPPEQGSNTHDPSSLLA